MNSEETDSDKVNGEIVKNGVTGNFHVEKRELVNYEDLIPSEAEEVEYDPDDQFESESSSSKESVDTPMRSVLAPVEDDIKNYDFNSPPQNGSQFLLLVQKQRKSIPKIASADSSVLQEHSLRDVSDDNTEIQEKSSLYVSVPSCPSDSTSILNYLPTQSWMSIVTHQFSSMHLKVLSWREMIEKKIVPFPVVPDMPLMTQKKKWFTFCFGSKLTEQVMNYPRKRQSVVSADVKVLESFFSKDLDFGINQDPSDIEITNSIHNLNLEDEVEVSDEESNSASSTCSTDPENTEGHPPQISLLLSLTNSFNEDLLKLQVGWLKNFGWFHEEQAQWIYALMACLEKPLSSAAISSLRDLVRICRTVRNAVCESKLYSNKVKLEDVKHENEEVTDIEIKNKLSSHQELYENTDNVVEDEIRLKKFVNCLNLNIHIVGHYFHQQDLADEPRVC